MRVCVSVLGGAGLPRLSLNPFSEPSHGPTFTRTHFTLLSSLHSTVYFLTVQ